MRAAWWWIDRWRKSTARIDMNLAERGAYRELLDEGWRRPEGVIPTDEPTLLRIVSCTREEWLAVRDRVLPRFRPVPGGMVNDTTVQVMRESRRRAAKQLRYRERGNKAGNAPGNGRGNEGGNAPQSPSLLDPSLLDPSLLAPSNERTTDTARADARAPAPQQQTLPQLRNPVLAVWRLHQRLKSPTRSVDEKNPLASSWTKRDIERRLTVYGEDRLALIVLLMARDDFASKLSFQTLMRNRPILRRGEEPQETHDHVQAFSEKLGDVGTLNGDDVQTLRIEGFEGAIEYARSRGWRVYE